MAENPKTYIHKPAVTPVSIYDRDALDEDDLWFLPQEDVDNDPMQAPLPRADRRMLFEPAEWARAQADLSGELAALCLRFGMLNERLGRLGEGARQRMAIREAADLSWWTGARIGAERLTLWLGQRTGGGADESLAMAHAGWAVRRLVAGQGPDAGGWRNGVAGFLGHSPDGNPVQEIAEVMGTVGHLHAVTQAAILFHAWRIVGQGPARDTEALVMAACHGAGMVGRSKRAGGSFLPVITSGAQAVRGSGAALSRLAGWIGGAEQAVLSSLMQLDRLDVWQENAARALADLSGRTPALLVGQLAAWPMVTAPMAEAYTGASRAAVQRNLEMLRVRGLVREITGQGRYRVWMAAL